MRDKYKGFLLWLQLYVGEIKCHKSVTNEKCAVQQVVFMSCWLGTWTIVAVDQFKIKSNWLFFLQLKRRSSFKSFPATAVEMSFKWKKKEWKWKDNEPDSFPVVSHSHKLLFCMARSSVIRTVYSSQISHNQVLVLVNYSDKFLQCPKTLLYWYSSQQDEKESDSSIYYLRLLPQSSFPPALLWH